MNVGPTTKTQRQRAAFRRFLTTDKERQMWREFLESDDAEVRFKAFTLWNAYTYGKPIQPTEVSGENGGAIKIEFVGL